MVNMHIDLYDLSDISGDDAVVRDHFGLAKESRVVVLNKDNGEKVRMMGADRSMARQEHSKDYLYRHFPEFGLKPHLGSNGK